MNDPRIWNEYHDTIAKEFFYLCSDKSVLEIAPFVVVACGFLYHLHSPFYFLELIVNQSDPEYIILDNIHHPHGIGIMNEVPNTPGNRYTTTPTWKTVNYSICLDFSYIDQALTDLGYRRINKIELAKFNNFSKERSWMASWQKNN